jgi:5'-AMP-activated protein kinase regulatory beta subunit
MGIASSKDGAEDASMQNSIPTRTALRTQMHDEPSERKNPLTDIAFEDEDIGQIVPTVFKWEHGGRNVYITGTFNNWERQIPMHRSGNDFSYVHNLKRGKHAFKFIVDDEWRFAPDQPTVADIEGRINNFIDVSDFTPYIGDDYFFQKSRERKIPESDYRQNIPDLDEYTKEPPSLPPHLRHIILNKSTPSMDPLALPNPQAVSLNHLYCTAIKDGMMVLGATQRYKEKYFTVVFYSVMPTTGCH